MRFRSADEVHGAVGGQRVLEEEPSGHVEQAERHDEAAPPGRATFVVALDGAQPGGAVREDRALRHAGGPTGEEDDAGVLARPDPRGAVGDASACHPGPVVITGTPNRPATARAGSSVSGWLTTSRGRERLERVDRLALGEVGVDRRQDRARFRDAVPELERVQRGRAPPQHPVERAPRLRPAPGGRRGWHRCRARRRCGRRRRGSRRCGGAGRARCGRADRGCGRPSGGGSRAQLAEPEGALHLVALVLRALVGGNGPAGRAHGEDLDQREPLTGELRRETPRAGSAGSARWRWACRPRRVRRTPTPGNVATMSATGIG